jgi:hypothetical protein
MEQRKNIGNLSQHGRLGFGSHGGRGCIKEVFSSLFWPYLPPSGGTSGSHPAQSRQVVTNKSQHMGIDEAEKNFERYERDAAIELANLCFKPVSLLAFIVTSYKAGLEFDTHVHILAYKDSLLS